jgi:hypothetical protein
MPYFQNVFDSEFLGVLLLSDRQYNTTFKVRPNRNSSTLMRAYGTAPYNTVGNTTLTINVSIDAGSRYTALAVPVTSGAAISAAQIVTDLNADSNFANFFVATLENFAGDQKGIVQIRARFQRENFKAYISNTSAETILKFNRYAGVAELPVYFARHTIANRMTYTDGLACLVQLTQPTDNTIITEAGLSTTPKTEYELLDGRSGAFMFYKQTVDSSSRITAKIEYAAGAGVGDLAKKTTYSYTAAQTEPDIIAEVPWVLTSGDLITPP